MHGPQNVKCLKGVYPFLPQIMPDFWERFDPPTYMQTNVTCDAHQISMCKSVNIYKTERGFKQNIYPKIKYFYS